MKLPENEAQFEDASNARYKKAGYWVHHMDTGIPGFPDTLVAKRCSLHIEYKFIQPSDEHLRMIDYFQSSQPGQIAHMISHGMKVQLCIYCGGLVFLRDASMEAIADIVKMTVGEFLYTCSQVYYSVYLNSIK